MKEMVLAVIQEKVIRAPHQWYLPRQCGYRKRLDEATLYKDGVKLVFSAADRVPLPTYRCDKVAPLRLTETK